MDKLFYETNYPVIEIFINGKYKCSTTWSKTCKDAIKRYKDKYQTDKFIPNAKITANKKEK